MLGYVTRSITLIIGIALHCIACCQEGVNAMVSFKTKAQKVFTKAGTGLIAFNGRDKGFDRGLG